ncbi:FUSC family protein [Ancylobacter sp. SL191]|uniref:FUSC family protein n=1 Tax=Ancylobacter sp. SL191 TaxID=2995166 RepID=UPI00226E9249|nr:FUSC family protein [Ancylobacter sp. SL191]WAC27801.1 FUSC family protein [Ancylobacter sp. SL191]
MAETAQPAAPSPAAPPAPPPGRWHGDGLIARSVRFTLTVMAPVGLGLIIGNDVWLIYALVICILATALDTGGTARQRLAAMAVGGVVVLLGTGLGTLVAGHMVLTMLAFALVGVVYALVESLHQSVAISARFACLTLAIGALYAPLQSVDAVAVGVFIIYAWVVSITWDLVVGVWRPCTAPSLWRLLLRLRATKRERWVFAGAVAITIPAAFFTSTALGLHRPYWALLAVVLVLREDSLASRELMGQTMLGTVLGVALSLGIGWLFPSTGAVLAAMMVAALVRWPAQQYHGALGNAALTVFIMLLLEFINGGVAGAAHDMIARLIDMAVGCAFALIALMIDRLAQRVFAPRPGAV